MPPLPLREGLICRSTCIYLLSIGTKVVPNLSLLLYLLILLLNCFYSLGFKKNPLYYWSAHSSISSRIPEHPLFLASLLFQSEFYPGKYKARQNIKEKGKMRKTGLGERVQGPSQLPIKWWLA